MAGRYLLVGLGSIGRRHLACLRRLDPDAEVAVLRRPGQPEADGAVLVHDMESALAFRPRAAIVANPAPLHVGTALALVRAGIPVLVEKPLSSSLDGVTGLLEAARDHGVVLQVGYCLRFEPSLVALKEAVAAGRVGRVLHLKAEVGQYLPDWRPDVDYRDTVSARADLGGGVLLELSHELDYLRWLGGEVAAVVARLGGLGDLEIDAEDSADLLLAFDSGASGALHMDMLQRHPVRTCKVVGSEGTLLWDGIKRETRAYRVAGGAGTWDLLYRSDPEDRDAMYLGQLRHFLECIDTGRSPRVTGADGQRVLQLVAAARDSAARGREVAV